jgi:hypothetical protein
MFLRYTVSLVAHPATMRAHKMIANRMIAPSFFVHHYSSPHSLYGPDNRRTSLQ